MKKILPTLTILILTIILTQPALAIDPVIIRKATHGPPPPEKPFNDTDDYFANSDDPDYKCGGIYKISESFEPKEVGTGTTNANGVEQQEFQPYDVNVIKGLFAPVKSNYTNKSIDYLRAHTASKPKLTDPKIVKKAFNSFDTLKPGGASNAVRRANSYHTSTCLRGQRITKAAQCALDFGKPGVNWRVCHSGAQDEAIACESGGFYRSLGDMETGCTKTENEIRLSDIAIALSQDGYMDPSKYDDVNHTCGTSVDEFNQLKELLLFYSPDADCYADPYSEENMKAKLIPSPAHLSAFIKSDIPKAPPHPISPLNACMLFREFVEAGGTGSNGRKIHTCSLEDGKEVDCQKEYTSIPWGDVMTNTHFNNNIQPYKQEIKRYSLCAKVKNTNESANVPNRVSFSVFAKEFFGRVENVSRTFSKGMYYSYKLDTNLAEGNNSDINAIKNLMPKKINDQELNDEILSKNTSSTDEYGKVFDPGNPQPRTVLYQHLTPKSWQKL